MQINSDTIEICLLKMIIKITRGNSEKRNIYIFFFSFHFYFSGRGIFQSGERMEKRREE